MNVRVIYRRDRYLRGGDHIPFLERGYPAARFTEPNENFAHQHQDVRVENGVQFGDLPRVLRLRLHRPGGPGQRRGPVVAGQRPRAPRRTSGSLTAELTNDTELDWDARRRGRPGRLRGGVAADHRGRLDARDRVGDVTTDAVDLSKDNVFFGVRAVGARRPPQPAAFPTPQR